MLTCNSGRGYAFGAFPAKDRRGIGGRDREKKVQIHHAWGSRSLVHDAASRYGGRKCRVDETVRFSAEKIGRFEMHEQADFVEGRKIQNAASEFLISAAEKGPL